jgi:DNA replication protein DnaC
MKKTSKCELTGREFEYEPLMLFGKEVFKPKYHPDVVKSMLADRERQETHDELERRHKLFGERCPRLFQETDEARLPDAWTAIQNWTPYPGDGKGLLLVGPTGSGKTRCTWKLLERLYLGSGTAFTFITEVEFGFAVIEALMGHGVLSYLNRITDVPLLVIDDVGKAKHTERTRESLFAVLDKRMGAMRPNILTTQFNGEELRKRFGAGEGDAYNETADAMLRRIRESHNPIELIRKEN